MATLRLSHFRPSFSQPSILSTGGEGRRGDGGDDRRGVGDGERRDDGDGGVLAQGGPGGAMSHAVALHTNLARALPPPDTRAVAL